VLTPRRGSLGRTTDTKFGWQRYSPFFLQLLLPALSAAPPPWDPSAPRHAFAL